jgi:hypothetical protein
LDFDLHVPLMSLPHILQTRLNSIPDEVPYLHAPDEITPKLDSLLKPHSSVQRIGIVWGGNPSHPNDHNRSCSLSDFRPLADVPGIVLFCLQKGERKSELEHYLNRQVINLSEFLGDFADTAAVLMQLDLVVAVDTAVAHLAGALGKPVWLVLPFAPDWRWLLDREDSPWYPTMRIFRQRWPGDWQSVFAYIAEEIRK